MKLTTEHKNILLYVAKSVTGTLAIFTFGKLVNIADISWIIISMLLVLSPDSGEVIPLTVVRVKANIVASIATVCFLLISPSAIVAICCAIVVTIALCYLFDLMSGSRPALAAVIIVAQHPPGIHLWTTAMDRVLAVIGGCAFGLVLTLIFHRKLPFDHAISLRILRSTDHGAE
jgi:uncharacterized membrane protein YccC